MRGSTSVYVDFVDYDEIAHHAGVTRAESLAAFYGLDDALRSIEQVIESGVAPRHYEVVLVSDHGQSPGAPFRHRSGYSPAARPVVAAGLCVGPAHQAGHLRP